MEGKFLNLIKNVYKTPTASIVGNGEKPEAFPLRSGGRTQKTTTRGHRNAKRQSTAAERRRHLAPARDRREISPGPRTWEGWRAGSRILQITAPAKSTDPPPARDSGAGGWLRSSQVV